MSILFDYILFSDNMNNLITKLNKNFRLLEEKQGADGKTGNQGYIGLPGRDGTQGEQGYRGFGDKFIIVENLPDEIEECEEDVYKAYLVKWGVFKDDDPLDVTIENIFIDDIKNKLLNIYHVRQGNGKVYQLESITKEDPNYKITWKDLGTVLQTTTGGELLTSNEPYSGENYFSFISPKQVEYSFSILNLYKETVGDYLIYDGGSSSVDKVNVNQIFQQDSFYLVNGGLGGIRDNQHKLILSNALSIGTESYAPLILLGNINETFTPALDINDRKKLNSTYSIGIKKQKTDDAYISELMVIANNREPANNIHNIGFIVDSLRLYNKPSSTSPVFNEFKTDINGNFIINIPNTVKKVYSYSPFHIVRRNNDDFLRFGTSADIDGNDALRFSLSSNYYTINTTKNIRFNSTLYIEDGKVGINVAPLTSLHSNGSLLISGSDTTIPTLSGGGNRLLYTPGKSALIISNANVTNENIGEFSLNFGQSNIAKTNNSFVFGKFNEIQTGIGSFIFGVSTSTSRNIIKGDNSVIFGIGNTIDVGNSFLFGRSNEIKSAYGFIHGHDNLINNSSEYSFIIGGKNQVTGIGAVSFGSLTSTSTEINNINNGDRSFTFGQENQAITNHSSAWGYNNIANALYSLAFGRYNNVTGEGAVAFGQNNSETSANNNVSGYNSFAMGQNNNVSGSYAFGFGFENRALGKYSLVFGENLTAKTLNEIVIGKNPASASSSNNTEIWDNEDYLLIVGCGSNNTSKDALTIKKSGLVTIGDLTATNLNVLKQTLNSNENFVVGSNLISANALQVFKTNDASKGVGLLFQSGDENNAAIAGTKHKLILGVRATSSANLANALQILGGDNSGRISVAIGSDPLDNHDYTLRISGGDASIYLFDKIEGKHFTIKHDSSDLYIDGDSTDIIFSHNANKIFRYNSSTIQLHREIINDNGNLLIRGTIGAQFDITTPGKYFIWNNSKGSFRGGSVTGNKWSNVNIGDNTFIFGDSKSISTKTFMIGDNNVSESVTSFKNYIIGEGNIIPSNKTNVFIIGNNNGGSNTLDLTSNSKIFGNSCITRNTNSIAVGSNLQTNHANEVVIGTYNLKTTYPRIFTLGNGTDYERSDAMWVTTKPDLNTYFKSNPVVDTLYNFNENYENDSSHIITTGADIAYVLGELNERISSHLYRTRLWEVWHGPLDARELDAIAYYTYHQGYSEVLPKGTFYNVTITVYARRNVSGNPNKIPNQYLPKENMIVNTTNGTLTVLKDGTVSITGNSGADQYYTVSYETNILNLGHQVGQI